MKHRVPISGSRIVPVQLRPAIRQRLRTLPPLTTIVHGAHWSGVDLIVDGEARGLGFPVERHPAAWKTYGSAAGPIRNGGMVKLGGDLAITWRNEFSLSSGTRDFQRQARGKIPLEERSVIGDIAAMKRHLYAIFAVVALGGAPACSPAGIATLAKVATVISETSSALAIAEQVWEQYAAAKPASPEENAKFSALLEDAWRALNAGSAAVRGAQNLTQEQYDAAFGDFKKAYAELHSFLIGHGVVGVPGTVGGGEQLPEPAVVGYKID